jgi:hypothetical protein
MSEQHSICLNSFVGRRHELALYNAALTYVLKIKSVLTLLASSFSSSRFSRTYAGILIAFAALLLCRPEQLYAGRSGLVALASGRSHDLTVAETKLLNYVDIDNEGRGE